MRKVICRDVYSMWMLVCVCLYVVSKVPQVGGSGGGWGSRLSAPICCSWPQGQRERKSEMIRLLVVHAARGGWLNTTAGVTNWTSLADIIESSPSLLPLSSFPTFTSNALHISNFLPNLILTFCFCPLSSDFHPSFSPSIIAVGWKVLLLGLHSTIRQNDPWQYCFRENRAPLLPNLFTRQV